MAVRFDQPEEVFEAIAEDVAVDQLFALAIHHADVHLVSVQIDGLPRARSVGLPAFATANPSRLFPRGSNPELNSVVEV